MPAIIFGLALAAIIIAAGTLLIVDFVNRNQSTSTSSELSLMVSNTVEESLPSSLEVKFRDGSNQVFQLRNAVGKSVFDALTDYAAQNPDFGLGYKEYSFGKFITKLAGIEADTAKEFWKFSINGQESSIGTSEYIIKQGDIIQFELAGF